MLGTILFIILALIAIAAAIGMLTSTNAVHAALFLVANFATIALFFLGMSAPFLAMVQITVYAGAIMVLFIFVIMLLGAEQITLASRLKWQIPVGVVLTVALVGVAALVLFGSSVELGSIGAEVPVSAEGNPDYEYGGPHSVGEVLYSRYLLPFELTGVLLTVAMVGAIVLAKDERVKILTPREKVLAARKAAEAEQQPGK